MNTTTLFCATAVLLTALSGVAQSASTGRATSLKPVPIAARQSQKPAVMLGVSSTDVVPGMRVIGPDQELIGTVLQAGETPDGIRAVAIVIDGKRAVLDLSELRLSGGVLISDITKAEILAKAARTASTQ